MRQYTYFLDLHSAIYKFEICDFKDLRIISD